MRARRAAQAGPGDTGAAGGPAVSTVRGNSAQKPTPGKAGGESGRTRLWMVARGLPEAGSALLGAGGGRGAWLGVRRHLELGLAGSRSLMKRDVGSVCVTPEPRGDIGGCQGGRRQRGQGCAQGRSGVQPYFSADVKRGFMEVLYRGVLCALAVFRVEVPALLVPLPPQGGRGRQGPGSAARGGRGLPGHGRERGNTCLHRLPGRAGQEAEDLYVQAETQTLSVVWDSAGARPSRLRGAQVLRSNRLKKGLVTCHSSLSGDSVNLMLSRGLQHAGYPLIV